MRVFTSGLIGLLALFALVGLVIVVNVLRAGHAETLRNAAESGRPLSQLRLRERISNYVGPVDPSMALLNPPARVAAEFIFALCGFPGFGWLFSGAVFTGIVLLSAVPALVWAIVPVLLSLTGDLAAGPFVAVQYLPGLAVGSAGLLAIRELHVAKRRKARGLSNQASPMHEGTHVPRRGG